MVEQELKLTARNEEVLQWIKHWEPVTSLSIGHIEPLATRFLAIYYDTEGLVLGQHQCSLRVRRENEKWRAAFKTKGKIVNGMSTRQEFECDVTGWVDSVEALPESKLKSEVTKLIGSQDRLIPRVTVDMQRTIFDLNKNGTRIELALDAAKISANHRKTELFEVELELKSGNIDEVKSLGSALQSCFLLKPSSQTKHQIGLSLYRDRRNPGS